ncbi:MAG: carboxypeptidase regulatory-like domain-containing protein [Planctomycetes bacterium]|nr:carboxypeptidase regulatory-like domain-containing protein [Planctomycetota bacterium]
MNDAHETRLREDLWSTRRRKEAAAASPRLHVFRRRLPHVVLVFSTAVGMACLCDTAAAHKVTVFATVRDGQIVGQVSLQGGAGAANTRVTVLDPTGRELARLVTDREGEFRFTPRAKCDHKLVANAGLGHTAEFLVPAAELPADLPATDAGGEAASAGELPARHGASARAGDGREAGDEVRALGQQLIALRTDLERWRNELRLQDILGGIGYILGVSGLGFYLLGLRRKASSSSQPASLSPASARETEEVANEVRNAP